MGSIFSTPKPPAQPKMATYRDEITGIEQVPVYNPDGSVTYITKQLPKTEEEKAKDKEMKKIEAESLAEILKLSSSDYELNEKTQKVVDQTYEDRKDYLEDSFDSREKLEEERLAKRGLSDSTAASSVRRKRQQDEYDASKNLSKEKDLLEDSIRNQKLQEQMNLYQLSNNNLNYEQAKVQKNINEGLGQVNAVNTANLASINDYYNRVNQSSLGGQGLIGGLLESSIKVFGGGK